MKALVVYDSVFGNTAKIAQAMGAVLDAPVLRVGDVQPAHWAGLDVLIVGSPTRAFSPLPTVSRWLRSLPVGSLKGVRVAAFDTRMDVQEVNNGVLTLLAKILGYAAEPIGKQLVKKGGAQALTSAGFIVKGSEGPLKDGELERAAAWAGQI